MTMIVWLNQQFSNGALVEIHLFKNKNKKSSIKVPKRKKIIVTVIVITTIVIVKIF